MPRNTSNTKIFSEWGGTSIVVFLLSFVSVFFSNTAIVKATGFSCDSGTLSDTCTVTSIKNLDINEVVTGSGSLVIGNGGDLRVATTSSFSISMTGNITIQSGGKITGNLSSVDAVNLTIDSGGSINVSGRGYVGGIGSSGTTCSGCNGNGRYALYNSIYYGGGGAYGGNGSPGMNGSIVTSAGGFAYGSTTAPTDFGSGGAGENSTYFGGNGGGAVKINVTGTLTNNGQILANGLNSGTGAGASYPSGGSGGSIWITAGTLAGNGTTSADGGNGRVASTLFGGGGGGGRIALYYTTDTSSMILSAKGGGTASLQKSFGGAGTIYKKQASWADGDLTLDNGGNGSFEYSLTPINVSISLGTTTIKNFAYLILATTTSVTFTAGNTFLTAGNVVLATSTNVFTGQTLTVATGTSTINVVSTTTNIPTFTDVTISSGGRLAHSSSTLPLIFNANNLTIDPGGSIDVTGKGYASSIGTTGLTCPSCGGGGGYLITSVAISGGGGYGGNGNVGVYSTNTKIFGGSTYGSTTAPTDFGSGGAGENASNPGGNGGGAVKINVTGTLTNNGQILANGGAAAGSTSGTHPSGGSGGSIWITAGTLAGNGTTSADGGNGRGGSATTYGGGGGGGRISVTYATDNSTIIYTAKGGGYSSYPFTYGGAGTIYKKVTSDSYGSLTLNNGGIYNATSTLGATTTTAITFASTTISGGAILFVPDNININAGSALSLSNYGSLILSGTSTVFTSGALTVSSGTSTIDVFKNMATLPSFGNVTISSGGTLTHSTSTRSFEDYYLQMSASSLNINAGGIIDVSQKGYIGGTSTIGVTCSGCGGGGGYVSNAGGGGAYGGNGGTGFNSASSTGGTTYGSSTAPTELGSGGGSGGSTYFGGNGGGAIKIFISGAFTNSGLILANGGAGKGSGALNTAGGGSGGSIWITAGSSSCSGSITANGGAGFYGSNIRYGGGGGGGRIFLQYGSGSSCSTLTATGGTASGIYGLAQDGSTSSATAPTVTSSSTISSLGTSTATLNGSITNTGGFNATVRGFEYGFTISYGSTTSESGSYGVADYSLPISSLTCNTTYHFRSYATNGAGTGYGSDQSFTTGACLATLTTDSASSVSSSEATLNGTVTATGGASITIRGFHYGLTTDYGATTTETGSFGAASFSSSTSALTPNTTYHFRAYATNSAGTAYGDDQQFVTSVNTPIVSTNAASGITTVDATLNGTVGDTGGSNITVRGFYYGLTTDYGATTTDSGSYGAGDFSSGITGLTCNTTYHAKAYATNSSITGYGANATFTTGECPVVANPSTRNMSSSNTVANRINNLVSLNMISQAELLAEQYGIKLYTPKDNSSTTTKIYFMSNSNKLFKMGDKHEDIRALQIYLNSHGYVVADSGAGSKGKETNLFGNLTRVALMKFQKKNKIPASGNFGPVTREFINKNQ